MANNRIFYACQLVGISKMGDVDNITEAHGVQSIGITTNFNLEQAFELGQIQIYENIEGLPDVEVTMENTNVMPEVNSNQFAATGHTPLSRGSYKELTVFTIHHLVPGVLSLLAKTPCLEQVDEVSRFHSRLLPLSA